VSDSPTTSAGRAAGQEVPRSGPAQYAVAAGFAALAAGVRFTLEQFASVNTRFVFFFPAIIAAALWLGLGPAVFCTLLCCGAVAWLWIEPGLASGDVQALLLFGASGAVVTLLVEIYRGSRAHGRAQDLVAELSRTVSKRDEELRERDALMHAVVETAVEAIITIDEHGSIRSFNLAAERIFGYGSEDVVGKNVSMLMPSPYSDEHDAYLAAYLTTGERKVIGIGREVSATRRDGTVFPVHLAVSEVPTEGRRLFTGFVRDLTEQKRLQREFLQAQKMEAVGNLSGGIAHDFNNLLMGILACSRIAGESLVQGSHGRELFEEIGAAANRGIALTRRLLAFSRRGSAVQLRPTSIDGVVRDNATMLRQLLGEDVTLVIELGSGEACVRADEGLVDQVLINLLVNARDAMPAGGEIRVETRCVGNEVVLAVHDTGSGIAPEVHARIFEPFFTTKAADKGTGLGLSTVKRIVEQLGGRIELETELGTGTTFRLTFPRTDDAPAQPAPTVTRTAASCAGRTVLLVEDDRLVRVALQRFLVAKGFVVLPAGTPAEAQDVARANAGIDVLVTDMILPGITGSELASRLRATAPALPAIFMSAHPAELLIEQGRLAPDAPYIEKPFEMEALERLLGEVLAS
jgi:PAS domain S-box-containing protein